MPAQPPPERVSRYASRAQVWVIMANDFPHMVKSTKGAAKRWVDKANKDAKANADTGAFATRIHYRYYEATVDGGIIK